MKRFLITACPRSGTKYMATLLSEIGVPCNWERIYHVNNEKFKWPEEPVGEVSWYSISRLDELSEDVIILHQTRDPRSVIGSMIHWNLLSKGKKDFTKGFHPIDKDIELKADKRDWSYLDAWYRVNLKIEDHAVHRYRIEDVDAEIREILRLIEFDADPERIETALKSVKRNVNSNGKRDPMDLSNVAHEHAYEMMARYGY